MKTTPSKILASISLVVMALLTLPLHSSATPINDASPQTITLTGTTDVDTWITTSSTSGLTAAANPGYPSFFTSTNPWPAPIGSHVGGDATLNKTANGAGGGPFPSGESIYFGSFGTVVNTFGGSLAVTDTTPISGLQTVVFQLEIGEAWGYDLFDGELPTLTYTYDNGSGTQTSDVLSASFSTILVSAFNGTVEMPSGTEEIYINLYALQWDLSAIEDNITSFTIEFSAVEHAQVYAAQVNQSDTMTQVVPEPSTYAMFGAGFGLLLWRLRRRGMLA